MAVHPWGGGGWESQELRKQGAGPGQWDSPRYSSLGFLRSLPMSSRARMSWMTGTGSPPMLCKPTEETDREGDKGGPRQISCPQRGTWLGGRFGSDRSQSPS